MKPAKDVCSICNNSSRAKFWIKCDKCQCWYHGWCVSVTKMKAEKLQFWHCLVCQGKAYEDDQDAESSYSSHHSLSFICICPEVQHNRGSCERFIGSCGICKKWFHNHCIRLVKLESGVSLCPTCHSPVEKSVVDKAVNTLNISVTNSESQTEHEDEKSYGFTQSDSQPIPTRLVQDKVFVSTNKIPVLNPICSIQAKKKVFGRLSLSYSKNKIINNEGLSTPDGPHQKHLSQKENGSKKRELESEIKQGLKKKYIDDD